MNKKLFTTSILITILSAFIFVILGYSQDDVTSVADSAYKKLTRHSVPFMHDIHNEEAQIDDCNVCHHVYNDGELSKDEFSEDMECSECHQSQGNDTLDLTSKYHLRCKGCHQSQKAGPVMCSECHIKSSD